MEVWFRGMSFRFLAPRRVLQTLRGAYASPKFRPLFWLCLRQSWLRLDVASRQQRWSSTPMWIFLACQCWVLSRLIGQPLLRCVTEVCQLDLILESRTAGYGSGFDSAWNVEQHLPKIRKFLERGRWGIRLAAVKSASSWLYFCIDRDD